MSTARSLGHGRAELLRSIPGLESRSRAELARVAAAIEETEFPPGEVLVQGRGEEKPAFLIVDGWAAVTVNGEAVAALGPGQFVGGGSLRGRDVGAATVVAKSPMRVLVIAPGALAAARADAGGPSGGTSGP